MPSPSKSSNSQPDDRFISEKQKFESALARLENAADKVLAARSVEHDADEGLERRAAMAAEHDRLKQALAAAQAEIERLKASTGEPEGDDLAGAYAALREEHEYIRQELESLRKTMPGDEAAEDAARLVRELAAARSAYSTLESSYKELQEEVLALRTGGSGDAAVAAATERLAALQKESRKVSEEMEAKRRDFERLSAIHDEVTERLGRVIDNLEAMAVS